ncbi:MAG: M20/M25/M40 family metallo-hydrolase [Lachnospirales bacterium]
MELKNFIFETISKVGVSGYEHIRGLYLKEKFSEYCDEVTIDTLGNVTALKRGTNSKKGKLMYMAHMDEIGLMVSHIDEKGIISLTALGGVDQRTLVAQEIEIFGKEIVKAVVGVKPPHLTSHEDAKKAIKLNELKVDTGLTTEKVKELISIGDVAVVSCTPSELLNDRISSRALDDICCVGVMYEAMKKLQNIKHEVDVYFVASVQEEITGNGAKTITQKINPNMGIVIDVNFAKTPEISDIQIELGKGPVFAIAPTNHRQILKHHKKIAGENGIDFQIVVEKSYMGTDACDVQVANYGIATADIGIPLRYMHTPTEVIDMKDIKSTARLICVFVESFNEIEDMEAFLCY